MALGSGIRAGMAPSVDALKAAAARRTARGGSSVRSATTKAATAPVASPSAPAVDPSMKLVGSVIQPRISIGGGASTKTASPVIPAMVFDPSTGSMVRNPALPVPVFERPASKTINVYRDAGMNFGYLPRI